MENSLLAIFDEIWPDLEQLKKFIKIQFRSELAQTFYTRRQTQKAINIILLLSLLILYYYYYNYCVY